MGDVIINLNFMSTQATATQAVPKDSSTNQKSEDKDKTAYWGCNEEEFAQLKALHLIEFIFDNADF